MGCMLDSCIASFHINPLTCGVARFNTSLAAELGVKVVTLTIAKEFSENKILLSIKLQEIDEIGKEVLKSMLANNKFRFDVFLHASDFSPLEDQILQRAEKVFAASSEIGVELSNRRADVISLFAPGAAVSSSSENTEVNLLTCCWREVDQWWRRRADRRRGAGGAARGERPARDRCRSSAHCGPHCGSLWRWASRGAANNGSRSRRRRAFSRNYRW